MFSQKALTLFGAAIFLAIGASNLTAQFGGFYVGDRGFGVHFGSRPHYRSIDHGRWSRRAPVHVHDACCRPVIHPGHYETVSRRVFTDGYFEDVHVPAEFVTHYDHCGRPIQVCIRPARIERRFVPGCWKTVCDRIWVGGHTTYGCGF